MDNMTYIYGPIASRRFGKSLGIAPIINNMCNFGCVYCQLGKIDYRPHKRQSYFPIDAIISEFDAVLKANPDYDVVSVVGDGEPLLHSELSELVKHIKTKTSKPVVLITNASLFYDASVRKDIADFDIISPSLDAYDSISFKRINRPYGNVSFEKYLEGIKQFSKEFKGKIWLEIMFMDKMNDSKEAIAQFKKLLKVIRYDKLYLNTPVRPPREANVKRVGSEKMAEIQSELGGIPIDFLSNEGYGSQIKDHVEAVISLIKRHPLHQFEIEGFLKARDCVAIEKILVRLKDHPNIEVKKYEHYDVYHYKKSA